MTASLGTRARHGKRALRSSHPGANAPQDRTSHAPIAAGAGAAARRGRTHGAGDIYQERAGCPVYTAIGVIEGRWKPMLFQRLAAGPHGFGELRRALPGVTRKVLREQLRQMQSDSLIQRRPLTPAVRGVRYQLTRYGRTLMPVFGALGRWGLRHLARPDAADGTVVMPPHPRAGRAESAADPARWG
jgi:DNA-binding HxlR family transcriptional regulator